jgi:DNA polymerase III delta subunit
LFGIFDLGNVIVEKNQQKILKMLNSLLGGGTSADFLVLLLQQHFISLYLVKNGKQPVGNRGFLVSRFREQSRGYSNSQLEQIIVALAEANVDLRHQRLTEELILEELTINLSNLN